MYIPITRKYGGKISLVPWTPTGDCLNYRKLTTAVARDWFGHTV